MSKPAAFGLFQLVWHFSNWFGIFCSLGPDNSAANRLKWKKSIPIVCWNVARDGLNFFESQLKVNDIRFEAIHSFRGSLMVLGVVGQVWGVVGQVWGVVGQFLGVVQAHNQRGDNWAIVPPEIFKNECIY